MKYGTRALLLAAGLACGSIPAAAAEDADFVRCDGYAAPKGKADGLTRGTWLYGLASRSADVRREKIPGVGQPGFDACERALEDPRLVPDFWLRKANLTQAKALHALAADKAELALGIAQESDAIGKAAPGPFFMRSIGLGNQAIRAYALIVLDRQKEAADAIDGLAARRPWSQSIHTLVYNLRNRADGDTARQTANLRAEIPLSPSKALALFWQEFLLDHYAQALEVAPAISFQAPKQRGGWTIDSDSPGEILRRDSDLQGAWAYSLSIAGREQEAQDRLTAALSKVTTAIAPLAPRADGKPPRKRDQEAHDAILPYATKAQRKLELWQHAVQFRKTVKNGTMPEVQQQYFTQQLNALPILPDILANIPQNSDADREGVKAVLTKYLATMDQERRSATEFTTSDLMRALPRPETAQAAPVLKPAGDGYFLSDSGLSRAQEGDTDIWTIRYTHQIAPAAATEELAMFGAAQTALKSGHDSMLVLDARTVVRTTHVSGMYVGSYDANSGYEAQLRVLFLNSAALPADVQPMAWRLIKARDVIASLEDEYKQSSGVTIAW